MMKKVFSRLQTVLYLSLLTLLFSTVIPAEAQTISFGASGLGGITLVNPTSLQFGPDDRLYVAQQDGSIFAYTTVRNGPNDYTVTNTETISVIKQKNPNYDDDGDFFNINNKRQITGIYVTGTAQFPVLYVTSSDYRIGGGPVGADKGLDTNSSVISRLTWTGTIWDHVQLVRGLPRSEENHSVNGMALDEATNTLYVTVGGSTNAGGPSNNFAFITEYVYSGTILAVDLTQLDNDYPVQSEVVGGQTIKFQYTLPTLDDPTRPNVNGIVDPADPGYDGIDVGDPHGGNDGLNQAKIDPGGPVSIYSTGWRNPFDIVLTESGKLYSVDNGANEEWGGYPEFEGQPTCTNNWQVGEPGSSGPTADEGQVNNLDNLHYITGEGFYAGHPVPIRGNPAGAGLFTHSTSGGGTDGVFRTTILDPTDPNFATQSLPVDWPPYPVSDANPVECDFLMPGVNDGALATWNKSTNGITEYTATNFGGQLQGNLLTASFNGTIYRVQLNAAGDTATSVTGLMSGFGNTPLDVIALGDDGLYPGTVWAVTYGTDAITVFEPADLLLCTGDYDNTIDEDEDQYTNADEIDNGTDPCSAADSPTDFDKTDDGSGFLVSDLNDPDDDNDTLLDTYDPFPIDANNGSDISLPLELELFNGFPGYGFFGLGLTGLMTDGTPASPGTDYLNLYPDPDDEIIPGGTSGLLTMLADDGTAATDDLLYGFQFGIDSADINLPYTVEVILSASFFASSPGDPTQKYEGFYIGDGTQDNYVAVLLDANGSIRIIHEELGAIVGASSQTYAEGIPTGSASTVTLYLTVDPITNTVTPAYKVDAGAVTPVGSAITVGAGISDGMSGTFTVDGVETGMAIGLMASSGATTDFNATWDNIKIDFAEITETGTWDLITGSTGSADARHESAFIEVGGLMYLLGGRGLDPVNIYDPNTNTWTDGATPPVEMHHLQPVEIDGLIYIIAGYSGSCCSSEFGLDHIYIYDPVADEWHEGAEIPEARRRGSVGTVVYNDEIYIIGGLEGGHGAPATSFSYFDKFDPTTNTWTILADAPRNRDHFSAVLINNKIYLAGGRHTDSAGFFNNTIPEVDVYDLIDETWSTLPAGSNIPTERAGTLAAGLGAEVVVVGGEGQGQAYNTTEALNTNTLTWRTLDTLNVARHSGGMAECNNTLYAVAGSGNQGGSPELNSLERYSLFAPTPCVLNPYSVSTLSPDPATLDFGSIIMGNNDTQTVTLSNTGGTQAIVITELVITGSSDFSSVLEYPEPVIIAPGESIDLDIIFTPSAVSDANATLTVNSSSAASTVITLTGTGGSSLDPVYRVNAGGGAIADTPIQWDDQAGYVAGGGNSNGGQADTNTTTAPDGVFDDEHYGNQTWTFTGLPEGDYSVNLFFLDGYTGTNGAGLREFDVEINGVQVLDNYDIWSEAGGLNIAISESFDTTVAGDGQIVVEFINQVQNASIRGIEIIPHAEPPTPTGEVLYRVNVGGVQLAAADASTPDWSSDTNAAPSPYRTGGGSLYNASSGSAHPGPIVMTHPSLDAAPGAPQAMFETERFDNGGTINWAFPVTAGQEYEIRLYFAELYSGIDTAGERVMDVTVEGSVPSVLDNIDAFGTAGAKGAMMVNYQLVAPDNTLNFSLSGVVQNPALKGVEIIEALDNIPPVVSNPGNQTNNVNDVVNLPISVNDTDNVVCNATGLPDGLSIDANCQITGAVANSCSGIYQSGGGGGGSFIEEGGLLVVDVDFAPVADFWTEETTLAGAIDGSYYEWRSGNSAGSIDPAGSLGVLQYPITITTPGIYQFQMRSAAPHSTEHNDVWARFVDADKVFGIKTGFPTTSSSSQTGYHGIGNGWFKVYQNVSGNNWTWIAKHKDNDGHFIYVEFDNAGDYTMELSGRSTMFKIDRLVLRQESVAEATATDINNPQSLTDSSACVYDVEITATDDGDPVESTTISFQWTINDVTLNTPPDIDAISDQQMLANTTLDVDIISSDDDADPISLSAEVRDSSDGLMDNSFYQLNDYGNGGGMITFTPTIGQDDVYTVTIFADDGINPPSEENFTLTVLASTPAVLDVTDSGDVSITEIDFGTVPESQTSIPVEMNLVNNGSASAINVTNIEITGTDAAHFNVSTTPITIDPLGSVELFVSFSPPSIGTFDATLVLTHDGTNGPTTSITLIGEGIELTAGTALYRVNVGGPELVAADASTPNWSADNAANPSPYRTGGNSIYLASSSSAHPGPIIMTHPSLAMAPAAPQALFETERYSINAFNWAFPVTPGQKLEVRLYFAELYVDVDEPGERIMDIFIEGDVPAVFNDIDSIATAGPKGAFVLSHTLEVTDDTLNISLDGIVQYPSIKGVEILNSTANIAPEIDDISDQYMQSNNLLQIGIVATDADDDPIDLSVEVRDSGNALMDNTFFQLNDFGNGTGTITFTPAIGQEDTYTVTVSATDNINTPDTEVFNLTVSSDALYRVNVGGPELVAADASSPNWSADNAANPSPYRTGGASIFNASSSVAHPGPIIMTHPSLALAPAAPQALFEIERFDNGGTINWAFPVSVGRELEVRLYFAELYVNADEAGERVMDATVEGVLPAVFDDIDSIAEAGPKGAFVLSYQLVTGDNTLNIVLDGIVENPALKGVEIIDVTNNTPPTIDPIADVTLNEFESESVVITTSDNEGHTVIIEPILPLPDFVTWNGTDTFNIDPQGDDAGNYTIEVLASDPFSTVQDSFDIEVIDRTITINSPISGAVISDTSVTIEWTSTGTTDNDHVHVTLNSDPNIGGQALDGSYTFNDLPEGTHTFTVEMATFAHILYDGVFDVITVTISNDSPEIEPIADQTVDEESTLLVGITATDTENDPIILDVTVIRDSDSAVMDNTFYTFTDNTDGTGSLNFTPGIGTAGTYTVTVTADDSINTPVTEEVFILTVEANVNQPPVIEAIDDQFVEEESTLLVGITATDAESDPIILDATVIRDSDSVVMDNTFYTFTDNTDGTGSLNFTPGIGTSGTYTVTVTADDSINTPVTEEVFTLTVGDNQPPVIEAIADQTVEEASTLLVGITATDTESDPIILDATVIRDSDSAVMDNTFYTFTDNTDGTGSLNFTPAAGETGTYTVTVTADDSVNTPVTEEVFTLTVEDNLPPEIVDVTDQTTSEGNDLTVLMIVTDNEDDALTVDATVIRDSDSAVMDGSFYTLNMAGATYALMFTPDIGDAGTYSVTVTADDDINTPVTTDDFVLTVTVNDPPVVEQLAQQINSEGDNLGGGVPSVQISATDPENDPIIYSMTGQPSGLTIDANTGLITGTIAAGASASSPYTVTVSVFDDVNPTPTDMTFQWIVPAPNGAPIVTAGADATIYLPTNTYALQGTVNDLTPTGTLNILWTAVGPGTVTFSDATDPTATATFPTAGVYTLTLTADDGVATEDDEVVITVSAPQVVKLELWNADTDTYIRDLAATDTIDLDATPSVSVVAITNPATVGSVRFYLNGSNIRNENTAPYAVAGDTTGDYTPWNVAPGSYTFTVTPFTGAGGTGLAGTSMVVNLTINDNLPANITQLPTQNNVENDVVTGVQVVATDPETDTLMYNIAGQPAGLNIDLFSGLITGTIDANAATGSPYTVIVSVFDGVNPDPAQMTFQWIVDDFVPANTAPVVDAGGDATVTLPTNTYALAGSVNDPTPTGTLNILWSGPAGVTFADATNLTTTATFPGVGVYVLTLTANDGEFVTNDTVTITVVAAPVGPAVVRLELWNSSTDTLIRQLLPTDTINLNTTPNVTVVAITNPATTGSVVFDLSGSATASTTDDTSPYAIADDTAGNLNNWGIGVGNYALTATAFENAGGTGLSGATVTVNLSVINDDASSNNAPLVPSRSITVESGQFVDFDLEAGIMDLDGFVVSVQIISGPNNGTITGTAPNLRYTPNPIFIGDDPIIVAAQDNLGSITQGTYTMVVRRTSANAAPVANAGADATITLPTNTYALAGSVTDATATGTLTAQWTATGPGTVTFVDATNPTTTATFPVAGTYTLTLAADDGEFIHTDDVVITVNPANAAPVANAGADATITLPTNTYALAGSANDPTPTGTLTTQWTATGPGTVTFVDTTNPTTTATFPVAGTYTLTLTANDGSLSHADSVVITVNPAPPPPPPPVQEVTTLELWDADTDTYIRDLAATDTIDLAVTPNVNIVAITNPATVGSVRFFLDGGLERNENVAPYTIAGDTAGDYAAWAITNGTYVLSAVPYTAASGGGTAGTAMTINLTVVNG